MNWERFAFPAVIAASVVTLYVSLRRGPSEVTAQAAPAGPYTPPPAFYGFDAGGFTGPVTDYAAAGPMTSSMLPAGQGPIGNNPNSLNAPYAYLPPTRRSPPWPAGVLPPNTLRYPFGLTAAQAIGATAPAPGSTTDGASGGSGGCGCGCSG